MEQKLGSMGVSPGLQANALGITCLAFQQALAHRATPDEILGQTLSQVDDAPLIIANFDKVATLVSQAPPLVSYARQVQG